jgi:hypothetical protein
MAVINDTFNFLLRYASPHYSILAVLEQVRLIPEIFFHSV